ncbi:DUF2442 domain-containing protein [Candidatus Electronema sp. JM]|uniref:DUF2442 domain-containing protein n=1 Tax=Candidatus Electronema sp. JM TaxID=3401571 RepID=UPI003AA7CE8C
MISASKIPWRKAVRVEPDHGYRLHVLMEDDEEMELDITHLLTTRESFWRLKNFIYFQKVAVDPLCGLCWPGGEDIAPDRIPHYAVGADKDM